jgi:serine/threonine-protein kinase
MREDRLNRLLLAWREQQEQGHDQSAAELCRDCPELTPELHQRIEEFRHNHLLPKPGTAPGAPAALPDAYSTLASNQQTGFSTVDLRAASSPTGEPGAVSGPLASAVPGYEILGELGRGGMGVVYKAWQQNLKRTVALKMILAGAHAGSDDLARFLREAETIARLKHPHVVQVYEFGSHEGKPYFSLEYLEGGSLASTLQGQPQAPAAAAQLVETLARAVQVAHEQQIVHRDLKPANILLTADGTPKITDFGLAKQGDTGLTATGDLLGTPSYMAPEQAEGKAREVGPAADIYALGAILYELLTGRPPFKGASVWDTLQLVTGTEAVSPSQLQPKVPRDLETICLKCLRKEPAGRYPSALALAEDLRRFSSGETIQARPVSTAERLWRWGRRNPVVATLATTLILVLVGSLAVLTALWLHAERQRETAQHERDLADAAQSQAQTNLELANRNFALARKAVDDCFLLATEDPLLQQQNMQRVRRLLLAKALPFYEGFRTQHADNQGLEAELAGTYDKVGTITAEIGRQQEALDALERARQLVDRLVTTSPNEPSYQAELARIHLRLAAVQSTMDRSAEADQTYDRAIALWRQLTGAHPETASYQSGLAKAYSGLGKLRAETGQPAAALKSYEQARQVFEALTKAEPENEAYRHSLALILNRRGALLSDTNRDDAALESYTRARAILERLVRDHPFVPDYKDSLALVWYNLANIQDERGQKADSLTLYEQAQKTLDELVRAHPDMTEYQDRFAWTCNDLGFLRQRMGQVKAARQEYERARAVWQELIRNHADVPKFQHGLAWIDNKLALLVRAAEPSAALRFYEEARETGERLVQAHPEVTAYRIGLAASCSNLADLLDDMDKPDQALTQYSQAVTLLEGVLQHEPQHPQARRFLRNTCTNRAETLTQRGRYDEAVKDWDRALELDRGDRRVLLLLGRAHTWALAGDHARATAGVASLSQDKALSPENRYQLACVQALCSAAAEHDARLAPTKREKQAGQYAALALRLLQGLDREGYFKETARVEELQKDKDLQSLRGRSDFQKWLAGLAKSTRAPRP